MKKTIMMWVLFVTVMSGAALVLVTNGFWFAHNTCPQSFSLYWKIQLGPDPTPPSDVQ